MTKEQILDRIELLRDVFSWSLQHNRGLSVGQRICLSQERASLMRCLDQLNENQDFKVYPSYCLPLRVEEKVQHIAGVIATTRWIKPNINF